MGVFPLLIILYFVSKFVQNDLRATYCEFGVLNMNQCSLFTIDDAQLFQQKDQSEKVRVNNSE